VVGYPQEGNIPKFADSALTLTYDLSLPYRVEEGRLLPAIQVGVEFDNGRFSSAYAVIDTGGEMSVFDGSVAVAAGVEPHRGYQEILPVAGVFGAASLQVYVHVMTLLVGTPARSERIRTHVAFTHPGVRLTFNVLGREGFLDHITLGLRQGAIPPQVYIGFQR
jgi:hypothetical protein